MEPKKNPLDNDGELGGLGLSPSLHVSLGGSTSTREGKSRGLVLDAVEAVDVLVENNLVASSATLASNDGGRGKEELPDAEPPLAILGNDLVLVGEPVPVPSPEGSRVVDTNGINTLNFPAGLLALVNVETERSGSVSAGEDVLVHEQTPDEILKLPRLAETSDLEEENTIIVEHIVALLHETLEVADADVLGHLQAGNLVISALASRDIAVIHAKNLALLLGNAGLTESGVAPLGLVAAESDAGSLGAIVDTGKTSESTPAAADIEEALALLEANLLADNGKLVILELLEGLLSVDVANDAGSVNHAGTKEPGVEIITAVVVVADLLLI